MTHRHRDTKPSQPQPSELPRPKHLPLIIPQRVVTLPDAVPARMLNEVMYCPRLMYLEWVQKEFSDNYFTVDGRSVHDRADSPGGSLPKPPKPPAAEDSEEEDDSNVDSDRPYQARSVWLASDTLGINAKIDIVEGTHDGRVVPIEYKRGQAPDLPEGAYLPERVQLCAQVLLLREHGYVCEHAEIYFAKSRRRVTIQITSELIGHTHWAIQSAREVALKNAPPDPLKDSPKCKGCSLVGICLPDEVNFLRRVDGERILEDPEPENDVEDLLTSDPWGLAVQEVPNPTPPPKPAQTANIRRLYAGYDDRKPVYVQEHGSKVGISGERLEIQGREATNHVRLMNISQIVIRGNVQVSTQALRKLLERGIPLIYLTGGGWYAGRLVGTDTNNIDLRIAQYKTALEPDQCAQLARTFVTAKIRNCRTMLRRNHDAVSDVDLGQLKQLARKSSVCGSIESLLGLEGTAARVYFQNFAGMLRPNNLGSFDFDGRNRRPPRDPINALLSFAYSLLTKELVIAVSSVGLEPLLGFYHQRRFGRPALALDLMEEFRPLIGDSVVLNVINNNIIQRDDFVIIAGACNIKDHARKRFIEAFERRMEQTITHPIFGYTVSYRRLLELQARLLTRVIAGELSHYPAFVTR